MSDSDESMPTSGEQSVPTSSGQDPMADGSDMGTSSRPSGPDGTAGSKKKGVPASAGTSGGSRKFFHGTSKPSSG